MGAWGQLCPHIPSPHMLFPRKPILSATQDPPTLQQRFPRAGQVTPALQPPNSFTVKEIRVTHVLNSWLTTFP